MNEMQNATSFDDTTSQSGKGDGGLDFLLEEGLELLSNFRAIEDRAVRSQVRALVAVLAGANR